MGRHCRAGGCGGIGGARSIAEAFNASTERALEASRPRMDVPYNFGNRHVTLSEQPWVVMIWRGVSAQRMPGPPAPDARARSIGPGNGSLGNPEVAAAVAFPLSII